MKLTNLNCPQCNGFLQQQQDMFFCNSCGSAFTIDYDDADVNYTDLVTQADRTKMLLQSDLEVMSTDFQLSEEMADREQQRKLQKEIKNSIGVAMKTAGVYIVIMVISMGAFIAMLLYSRKNWQRYQENKAAEDKKEQQLISDLVSSNAHFLENEAARGQRYEFNLRIGAPVTDTRYVQARNANMCGDPQACEMYVMTDTKYNHQELWIIYQIPYEYEDTAERFYVYDVIGFPELGRDKYGDPTANTQCNEYSASSRWNGYLDKEQLCRECIFGNTKYEAELIDTEKGGADK